MTTPEVSDISVRKDSETWDRIIIKGSNRTVSERVELDTSFTDLRVAAAVDEPVVMGSETLYEEATIEDGEIEDPGRVFDRGVDYEVNYEEGEIRATDVGGVETGHPYPIEYRHEVTGSYPSADDVDADAREIVQTVPGVSSQVAATSLARILYEKFSTPRHEVDVVIPRDTDLDPLEALSFDELDIPDDVQPLAIYKEPQITTSGIKLKLGSRGLLEEALGGITDRLGQISRQT